MSSSPSKGTALIRQDSKETPKQMAGTYTAVEVSAPGMLRVVERRVSEPGPGQVRIRVEACGICHTDAATVTGIYPGLTLPRVPVENRSTGRCRLDRWRRRGVRTVQTRRHCELSEPRGTGSDRGWRICGSDNR